MLITAMRTSKSPFLPLSSELKMQAAFSSETIVTVCQTTQQDIPQDHAFNICCCYDLRSLHRYHQLCLFPPDPSELPLCEISLACDNLLCDGHGRPPNPVLVVHVYNAADAVWIKYARTEVVEVSFIIMELSSDTAFAYMSYASSSNKLTTSRLVDSWALIL